MTENGPILEMRNVGKWFGNICALYNINLQVKRG